MYYNENHQTVTCRLFILLHFVCFSVIVMVDCQVWLSTILVSQGERNLGRVQNARGLSQGPTLLLSNPRPHGHFALFPMVACQTQRLTATTAQKIGDYKKASRAGEWAQTFVSWSPPTLFHCPVHFEQ